MRGAMHCPSCGTENRDEALFCKYCGADLSKAPRPGVPPPPAPPPALAAVPPTMAPPRPWWHGLGVVAILASFLVFVDLGTSRRLTWSIVATLALAFLAGGVLMLQVLASPGRRDRRPFLAGAVLVVSSVLLLPVALALQSAPATTDVFTVPFDPAVRAIDLSVADEAGRVRVQFVATTAYLVRVEVTHLGGLFSSHYAGDVSVVEDVDGPTLTYRIVALGFGGYFFPGGHDIVVSVQRDLIASLEVHSTTGAIEVDVPAGVAVRALTAVVTTGGVMIRAEDARFENATVRAVSTTGGIAIAIDQGTARAGVVEVLGTTTTGSVTFAFRPGADVAARVASQTTTGGIQFDGARYEGSAGLLWAPTQEAYASAGMKFNVELSTTTGGITIG